MTFTDVWQRACGDRAMMARLVVILLVLVARAAASGLLAVVVAYLMVSWL